MSCMGTCKLRSQRLPISTSSPWREQCVSSSSTSTEVMSLMMTVQAMGQASQVSRYIHLTSDPSVAQIKQQRDTPGPMTLRSGLSCLLLQIPGKELRHLILCFLSPAVLYLLFMVLILFSHRSLEQNISAVCPPAQHSTQT